MKNVSYSQIPGKIFMYCPLQSYRDMWYFSSTSNGLQLTSTQAIFGKFAYTLKIISK